MRFKESLRRQVVETASATKVGRVERFVVNAARRQVVALVLGKVPGDGKIVDWDQLQSFGRDAVTVPSADRFRGPHGQTEERWLKGKIDLLGAQVLTERGDGLGEVQDVDFDAETGEILALQTSSEEVKGARILGLGGYAVVVSAPER